MTKNIVCFFSNRYRWQPGDLGVLRGVFRGSLSPSLGGFGFIVYCAFFIR